MLTPEEQQELAALQQMKVPRAPAQAMGLTDEEQQELELLKNMTAPRQEEGGFLSAIGDGLAKIGSAVDSVGGAPTRAAIGAAMNGNNPLDAAMSQFGADPSLAPTGKEIAQVAGLSARNTNIPRSQMQISDDARAFKRPGESVEAAAARMPQTNEVFSPAGVAGTAVDMIADPLNFIPVGLIAKAGAKATVGAVKGTAKIALKGSVAGLDAAAGTKSFSTAAETTSKYLDRVIESTKSRFNPKQASDFKEYSEIAKRNNIDPSILTENSEFGPQSTLTKKAKTLAEGPGGEGVQQRFIKAQGEIEAALDNKIATVGGGVKVSDADAGRALIDGYNNGIKSFFDQDMITHTKVINANPGMVLNQDALKSVKSKITGLSNRAKGRIRRGFGDQQAEASQLLKDLDIVERSIDKNGNLSYKRASELLTNLGEEAFKKNPVGSKLAVDQKGLQELYFSLRDSMYESAGHVLGPEAATELAMNNQIISSFLKEKGRINKIFEGDLAPEKLFKRIAESGDTKQINALKEILSPEDFKKLKGAILNKVVVRNADGAPLYGRTLNRVQGKASILDEAFQPEEIHDFIDLLRLGDRESGFVFNTSNTNTAARFSAKDWIGEIVAGGVDELTLERLKEVARGKAKAIEVPFSTTKQTVTPTQAKSVLKQLPLLNSQSRQTAEIGRLSSVQETNREIERRKRATASR